MHITVVLNPPQTGNCRARNATNSSHPPASSTLVTMRHCKRLAGSFAHRCSADNRSHAGFGAAGNASLTVGISIGAPMSTGRGETNGADQSSTGLCLSDAGKTRRSKFLKVLRIPCGSGQERRCAHSISLAKRESGFPEVLLTLTKYLSECTCLSIGSLERAFIFPRNRTDDCNW